MVVKVEDIAATVAALTEAGAKLRALMVDSYLGRERAPALLADPRVSPLHGAEMLPPALIVCGDADPLAPQAAELAERLEKAGKTHEYLTVEKFQELLSDTAHLAVSRYELANIHALNFVVEGILGLGVAASVRNDPQAKGFGEYLRAKVVDMPIAFVPNGGSP